MADFKFDIGDLVDINGEAYEVVSRAELTGNDELQYTIISKPHADARREAERAATEETESTTETPAEDAAPAVASEEPQTLLPR